MVTTTYVVKYGDWLAKIAQDHGTTVSAIWNHPENAAHRQKRGSPDVLYPGDVLRIDVAGPAPTSTPGVPPTTPAPTEPAREWPYPPFEGPWSATPTWECPGGTCVCHPVPEDGPKEEHTIVFYTTQGARMPGARCKVFESGRLITPDPTTADGAGELRVELRETTASVRIEWAPPDLPEHDFLPYHKTYHVKMNDDAGDVGLDRRLSNLGFSLGRRREDNVRDYERAYGREPTGDPDAIRLEVLERHDDGAVGVFHPQEPQGETPVRNPANRSFFGSPPQESRSSRLGFAADGQGGGGGGGGNKTAAGQNVKGSAVPDATNMLLYVALVNDFPELDPKKIELRVVPLKVPGIPAAQQKQPVKPFVDGTRIPPQTIQGVFIPDHLIYGFKDLPLGTYSASATMESVAFLSGAGTTGARGSTEVELKMGLLSLGMVALERSPYMAICQDMKSATVTEEVDKYYQLAHLWSEKWTEARPAERGFHKVTPDAATADPLDEAAIDALAGRMLEAFKLVCEKAWGGVVYSALGHGGVDLAPNDKLALPGRRKQLEEDKATLKQEREALSELKRTPDKDAATKKAIEEKEKWIEGEQARIDAEDARVNRALFPTFSLGSQRGGLHLQYLSLDYEYFVFLDNPDGGFSEKEKKAYKARQRYFAGLKALFRENKIQTLYLIACNIGQDDTFVGRVAKELGVQIVAYKYFTLIKSVTGFIGLSKNHKTDDIHPATSVEPPPTDHATVAGP